METLKHPKGDIKIAVNPREKKVNEDFDKCNEAIQSHKYQLEINEVLLAYLKQEKAKFK